MEKGWRGGASLRAFRERYGITAEELASLLGCSRALITHWERGIRAPDAGMLKRLSDLFGFDINDLLDGRPVRPTRLPPGAIGMKMKLRGEGFTDDDIAVLLVLYEKLAPRNRHRQAEGSPEGSQRGSVSNHLEAAVAAV